MTQFFAGYKPGVGPVVKVLKYDADNPLSLANDAYDRYFFNSENQKLSYVFGAYNVNVNYVMAANGFTGVFHINGNANTAWNSGYLELSRTATEYNINYVYYTRIDNVWPGRPYLPIFEARYKDEQGRVRAAYRSINSVRSGSENEWGVRYSYQFPTCLIRVQSKSSVASNDVSHVNWVGNIPSELTMIPLQTWVGKAGFVFGAGANSILPRFRSLGGYDIDNAYRFTCALWALPANSAALPTYSPGGSGQEIIRVSGSKVGVARPGYNVGTGSGVEQMIIDSGGISTALCVMAGLTPSIAANGGTYSISPPPGIILSDDAQAEMMVRRIGEVQYIPAHVLTGLTKDVTLEVYYEIVGNQLRFINNSTFAVAITYAVFNTDGQGTSSGGALVEYIGNDGTQNFLQWKRPGTSDPASRPNDILLDTRLPTIHIIREGWLPLASFSTSPTDEQTLLGLRRAAVTFDDAGLIPFVKYTVVFQDYILSPIQAIWYMFAVPPNVNPNSPAQYAWGPPSNQSALCRLGNGVAHFYLNPGSFTSMVEGETGNPPRPIGVASYNGPDPLGIRYYILGIPTT